MFSLVTMGYNIEELFDHAFIKERSGDFHEMLLHHIATVTLYGGMIVNNSIIPGSLTAYIHLIADVPTGLTKLFS